MEQYLEKIIDLLSSPSITDWLMIAITFVYVVATIFICFFNYRSAKASQNQIEESKNQFEQMNKPNVVVSVVMENNFICISIKNIGNDVADNIKVQINDDWLTLIDDDYLTYMQELCNETFMLAPNQEIIRAFSYVLVGIPNSWLDKFDDCALEVTVMYNKHNSITEYKDKFIYNIKLFRKMFIEKSDNEKEIKEISKTLKDIEKKIKPPFEIKIK